MSHGVESGYYLACVVGEFDTIIIHLSDQKQVNPSCQNEDGWTPLHVASENGHLDIMRWLVDGRSFVSGFGGMDSTSYSFPEWSF